MKATGIVRRIDDLGRIVIPKEIRRTMRIREGDPLEIYTDKDGEVIFKKYSPIGEMSSCAGGYCEVLSKLVDGGVVITDRDSIIAASGAPKKDLLSRRISPRMEQLMESRSLYKEETAQEAPAVLEGGEKYRAKLVSPVVVQGDVIGSVIFLQGEDNPLATEVEVKLAVASSGFLGRQAEE